MIWSLLSLLAMNPAHVHAQPPAAEIKINYDVRLHGKQICSGTRIIELNRATELCTRDYNQGRVLFRVKVSSRTPQAQEFLTAEAPNHLPHYLVTGYLSEHDKDGMPTGFSTPQILTLEAERAEITTRDENNAEVMGFAAQVSAIK